MSDYSAYRVVRALLLTLGIVAGEYALLAWWVLR